MKTLSLSLYKRPKYTQIVIDALRQCEGIENYKIIVGLEPGFPEVETIARSIDFTEKEIHVNPTRFGCQKNVHACLTRGFNISNFHIHIEDDTVPGRDMLKYFEFCDEYYKNNTEIFTISAYNKNNDVLETQYDKVWKYQWFTPWGWATWADRWKELINDWDFGHQYGGWDWNINRRIRKNRYEIKPLLSRTQNIGSELGTYCTPEYHSQEQFNKVWVNSTSANFNKFTECDYTQDIRQI
jgi:hypothetical protein